LALEQGLSSFPKISDAIMKKKVIAFGCYAKGPFGTRVKLMWTEERRRGSDAITFYW
jgi:hypothetical protein